MMPTSWLLLAQGEVTTRFEWGRIQSNSDWILPVAVTVLILLVVRLMYQRDAAELPPWASWLLTFLRSAAFFGLLLLYLEPKWRSEREIVYDSRALVLVDTSMSMNRVDNEPGASGGATTRLQQVAGSLDDTDFLERLRKTHVVSVHQFGDSLDVDRVIKLPKVDPGDADKQVVANEPVGNSGDEGPPQEGEKAASAKPVWRMLLEPRGTETHLGEALQQLIGDESNSPVSGIVLIGDGGQNAGRTPEVALEMARKARPPIPIFTVGVGSERKPAGVRVVNFETPGRASPADRYSVSGEIQGHGLAGRTVRVDLLMREGDDARNPNQRGKGTEIDHRSVTIDADGKLVPVKFDVETKTIGRRMLCLRVQPPPGDTDPLDKFREAEIEIIDRKTRVLLMASGPMRDYQFLQALLARDRTAEVDVFLQSAQPGVSQQANKILDDFPDTPEKMHSYDCVVAFDPDWSALRLEQIELLKDWVSEEGGGLILVAGAAHAGNPVEDSARAMQTAMVKYLYPVEFQSYVSVQGNRMYSSKEPWAMEFTPDGLAAEYLWLADTSVASQQAWTAFPGVHSFMPIRGKKAGATVLARLAEPGGAAGVKPPIYMAEHLLGPGRVFYMGSGEMWRLRREDPGHFERFYTKLIRHVSQGRLRREKYGVLIADESYHVGKTVKVTARLLNSESKPLVLPAVTLQVSHNGVMQKPVTLQPVPDFPGSYSGHFPALREGDYRLELPVPQTSDARLARMVRVTVPRLEDENPQRNVALLSEIAKKTGGTYYASLTEALADHSPRSLAEQLKGCRRTDKVPVAPDPLWEQEWMQWMMIALCSVLCLEWLLRRLARLA